LAHLNVDAVIANLELPGMTGLNQVILEGDKGDPLMHPHLLKLIHALASAPTQPRIQVYTNGSIRSAQWWRDLAQKNYANLRVIFSIDGLADTNHLYRVGLDYDIIMQNVQAFISDGGHAIWKFILFKHNEHQLDSAIALSREMGFEEFIHIPCRQWDFQGLDRWPVRDNDSITHYIEPPSMSSYGHITNLASSSLQRKIQRHPHRLCPNLSKGQVYITYLGQVLPCCMMHFDTTLNYPGTDHLRALTGGFHNQDLNQHTMSQVLEHQFFTRTLHDSLKTVNWHSSCKNSCTSQITENLKYVES
jgi:sulfatase maturation enzyme AslB (radical SAM superfamily)